MDFGQLIRHRWREMRMRAAEAHARAADAADEHLSRLEFLREWRWSSFEGLIAALAIIVAVIYPLAAWVDSTIDDNPDFAAPAKMLVPGKSHAVANAAALVSREVNKHGWTANAPWFWPTALLDDMPAYQSGIVAGVRRFADTLPAIGRESGTTDSDLADAVQLLRYPPDIWVWNPSYSIWPVATSASQYKRAARSLRAYNSRLAAHQAKFEASAANLAALLGSLAHGLDIQSTAIEAQLDRNAGWPFDFASDDVFYRAKGEAYADYIVLKGAQSDFGPAIRARNLEGAWAAMMKSLKHAIGLRPGIVLNGAPDSSFFPCPLCGEGFHIARAQTQLRTLQAGLRQ